MLRIGQSSDIHPLKKGRKLILGGVLIPHDKGCLGHSDADALLHTVAESILGALALGDLGTHFPGYEVNNLDALIQIEKPKMAPYIHKMQENIAVCLHCDLTQVSVKATRGEKLGFVGREEGVLAQCVILLRKKSQGS